MPALRYTADVNTSKYSNIQVNTSEENTKSHESKQKF